MTSGPTDARQQPLTARSLAHFEQLMVVHDFYQHRGAEDQVFEDEVALLRRHGHSVTCFAVHNDAIAHAGRIDLAAKTVWNRDVYRQLSDLVARQRPAVVHFHNTFPLISPAAYYAARDGGAAVVQTLHNYRLLCPSANLYRNGAVCEDCVGKLVPWPAVAHRCYRGGLAETAVTAAMLAWHNASGTWRHAVDAYVTLSESSRRKFVQGGLPEAKLTVKPNFVDPDPGEGPGDGGYFVFVGRLTPEKGILQLLDAWKGPLRNRARLKIVGDGPSRQAVAALDGTCGIEYLGWRSPVDVLDIVGRADALLFPSLWHEPFGRTVVEAYAKGTPVIAARSGSIPDMVRQGETGLLYRPDGDGLVAAVEEALRAPDRLRGMRGRARQEFVDYYTADRNYPLLLSVYERARNVAAGRVAGDAADGARAADYARPFAGPRERLTGEAGQ